jgi:putative flippase GtrA
LIKSLHGLIRRILQYRFIKFLFVGGLNTLFSYALYAFLLFAGCNFVVAATVSTLIGILFNFKTTGKLVFKNSDNKLLFKFFGVYGVTYTLNIFFLRFLSAQGVNAYLSGAITVFPVAVLSFVLMRTFVFPKAPTG